MVGIAQQNQYIQAKAKPLDLIFQATTHFLTLFVQTMEKVRATFIVFLFAFIINEPLLIFVDQQHSIRIYVADPNTIDQHLDEIDAIAEGK